MAVTAATPAPGRLAADRAGMAASSELMAGLPVVNAVLARLGFDAILTAWLPGPDPRCAMATATVIGVLVRNLALGREPLYGLAAWAARFDETLLGLAHGQAAMLNDDRAGRALDELYAADRATMTTALALAAISAAITSSPVTLPAIITTIAGYLAVAGTVFSSVSQITLAEE